MRFLSDFNIIFPPNLKRDIANKNEFFEKTPAFEVHIFLLYNDGNSDNAINKRPK